MAPHELKFRAPVSKDLRDLLRILGQIDYTDMNRARSAV